MALTFNEGAYSQAYQQGQENERRPDLNELFGQPISQGLNYLAQSQQLKTKAEQDKKLYELQLAEAQRKTALNSEGDMGLLEFLSGNKLSSDVAPQSMLDQMEMPQGMGEAAMPMGQQPGMGGGMIEKFRQFKQGKLQAPQMNMSQPDPSILEKYGFPQEAANIPVRRLETLGIKPKPMFAAAGQSDYESQKQDLDLQTRQARLDQMRNGGQGGTQKIPTGYRYTNTGDLEPIPGGPADRKVSDTANKVSTVYDLYKTARDGLLTSLENSATGPIVGKMPALTSDQQTAQGAVAAMAPVLKQLFRVAGEGVFTDRDQALLMQMIPTREMLPEARDNQIKNIDAIVKAKLGIREGDEIVGGQPGGGLDAEKKSRLEELRRKKANGTLGK